jgi:hypothetical protein
MPRLELYQDIHIAFGRKIITQHWVWSKEPEKAYGQNQKLCLLFYQEHAWTIEKRVFGN